MFCRFIEVRHETRTALRCSHISYLFCALINRASSGFIFPAATFAGNGNEFVTDFNGDGKLDILTSDGTMNLGNGDSTFTAGTNLTIPTGLSVLAVADFNGDGKPDILEQGTGTRLVLLGNGDGTFQTTPISTRSGASLSPVSAPENPRGIARLGRCATPVPF